MSNIHITPSLMRRLEMLYILSRGVYGGNPTGERRSIYRGVGIEFADHKEYTPGDDFRYIDWNVLARTNELFIKLFEREENVYLYILVDSSSSMRVGEPEKFHRAREIAAALAHIALAGGDMVKIGFFTNRVVMESKLFKDKRESLKAVDFLNVEEGTDGETSFAEALSYFSKRTLKRGLVFIISDFLDRQGVADGMRALLYRKFHMTALHMVSAEEINPGATGEFTFLDMETGEVREVTIRRNILERYDEAFEEHRREVERFLRSFGGDYVLIQNKDPLEEIFTKILRHAKVLK